MYNWINDTFSRTKRKVISCIPVYWPELKLFTEQWLKNPDIPQVIIPVASCKAVGGKVENVINIGAALMAVLISLRILDDLQDRDKPDALWSTLGPARTFNYSYTFNTIAFKLLCELPYQEAVSKKIFKTFIEGSLITLAGQDRDLKGVNTNWDDYWRTAEMKTCYITSTGAAMGAMVGTSDEKLIQACRQYGYHWGLTLQILNDMEGVWEPEGKSDLEQGKVSLPVLYALRCQHPEKDELLSIVQCNQIASKCVRVKQILDNTDAKSYLIWSALRQRDQALKSIEICSDKEGKSALEAYLTGMFGDIDELITADNKLNSETKEGFENLHKVPANLIKDQLNTASASKALNIRRKLRMEFT